MEERRIFKLTNAGVAEYTVHREDEKHFWVLPAGIDYVKIPKGTPKEDYYDDKMDAMYANFVRRKKHIENYKSSKYYKYYLKRAKKENPELII